MAKYTGQLGTLLEITVPSLLLGCRWSQSEVLAGGEIVLLIHTGYVGDGAPVDFRILDENGSTVEKLKGMVRNNIGSAKWTVSDKSKGKLIFIAEARDVDLVGRSDTLTVLANAGIGPVTVTDPAGKTIAEIPIGERIRWVCRLPGVPDDTSFSWAIECHQDKAHQTRVAAGRGVAKQSQGVVLWESRYPFQQADKKSQKELDKTSETYKDAFFQTTFTCLGVTAKSAEVKARTTLTIRMKGTKKNVSATLPDGTKKDQDASQDPILELESPEWEQAGSNLPKEALEMPVVRFFENGQDLTSITFAIAVNHPLEKIKDLSEEFIVLAQFSQVSGTKPHKVMKEMDTVYMTDFVEKDGNAYFGIPVSKTDPVTGAKGGNMLHRYAKGFRDAAPKLPGDLILCACFPSRKDPE